MTSGVSSNVAATGALVNSCENATGCKAVRNAVISKVLHAAGVLTHHDFGDAELGNYHVG